MEAPPELRGRNTDTSEVIWRPSSLRDGCNVDSHQVQKTCVVTVLNNLTLLGKTLRSINKYNLTFPYKVQASNCSALHVEDLLVIYFTIGLGQYRDGAKQL